MKIWKNTKKTLGLCCSVAFAVVSLTACSDPGGSSSSSGGGSEFTDPNYSVGDTGPAGGTIFYVAADYSEGWKYLEAAPENGITGEYSSVSQSYWDEKADIHITGTLSDLGSGKENTEAYINQTGSRAPAAAAAKAYRGGGKSDWYLPSLYEMKEILLYLYAADGTATGTRYVTSTEHTATSNAGAHHAYYDSTGYHFSAYVGTNESSVWPVRRF